MLALAAFSSAQAADTASSCKLKGGSIVPLPAEACAKEGGTMVTAAEAAAPAPVYQLSADAKLAAPQKAILDLLSKPVVGKVTRKGSPEGVERSAKFAECTLTVDENLQVDYGNIFSSRKIFKISSTVDFKNIKREAFGIFGEVASKGGLLKAQAVYFEEPTRRSGNNISISVSELYEGNYKKFTMPGLAPYWDAPSVDLWMADVFGYVPADSMGNVASSKIRILYIVNSADDAASLKKAFDEIAAVCGQPKAQ
jgi:hypothetical protein